jgi:putative membrane-bound dehydrogenase-like protein
MHLTSRIVAFLVLAQIASAQEPAKDVFIPRRQDVMPGPALSPAEAIKKMVVPEGFKVELVAAEPDVVNPVAMTFDERGRVWITESFEYPRREPGPGRDRVKTLEDTDGDGTLDKVTIFAEGLNIPSGIAVGYGGVWVANSPDILFMQDTDGDGKADKQEVVVTGFGRDDTHELPNSLTWGPDGWLYGLNGVFNPSKIVHQGKTHNFTCAMFRIHPRTRAFEVFCEGTSNPWGIAIDKEGSFFVSACVIDHLWHLVETGYYHRQGGPYPPYTWKIESIVKHKHQLAAYCGIHYYDSDAYPPQYREKLYMGNVHGNCINSDRLERDGSTYRGLPEPDFLKANDAWFMPVVQKTGPDGCLWILDWYDRYHCYQDANRDPAGIDRGHGRLYRVRYQDTPRAPKFDLSKETDEQLIERLKSPNGFFRDIAQRLLAERANPETLVRLEEATFQSGWTLKQRLGALWARLSAAPLNSSYALKLLQSQESELHAWGLRGIRHALNSNVSEDVQREVRQQMRLGADPAVKLQLAITVAKSPAFEPDEKVTQLLYLAERMGQDSHLQRIIWANLQPLLKDQGAAIAAYFGSAPLANPAAFDELLPRIVDRLLSGEVTERGEAIQLIQALAATKNCTPVALDACWLMVSRRVQSGEIRASEKPLVRQQLEPELNAQLAASDTTPARRLRVATLMTNLGIPAGAELCRNAALDRKNPVDVRMAAAEALIFGRDEQSLTIAGQLLTNREELLGLQQQVVAALGRSTDEQVIPLLIDSLGRDPTEVHPVAIDVLTERDAGRQALILGVNQKRIDPLKLNVNQIAKLVNAKDAKLAESARAIWGTVRTDRNPQREQVVAQMRELLKKNSGDPHKGSVAFHKLCGQCHKIHGQGQDVGPDITVNGRASIDQLLSNVFDPSLVIGKIYQAYTVVTTDGRTLTGLLVEDNPQRVVLKVQGGKIETIARKDIDEIALSKLSLMPEGVEKQLSPEELRDLLAFLVLDKAPSDPTARMIPDVKK